MMSLTRTVPAALPSVFHSSSPSHPVLATKNVVPPMVTKDRGSDDTLALLVLMSRTRDGTGPPYGVAVVVCVGVMVGVAVRVPVGV